MTTLILNRQFKQFDLNGEPLAAGRVYTYEVGTTTPKTTYQDADATIAHTNPIILDSFGEATIYISGDTKFIVKDSDDVEIRTYPLFEDTLGTLDTPVISSPSGAVFRSDATETGYIKIQLPMSEWPNTKLSMTVLIYEDTTDESIILNLSGYASSISSDWSNTTSKTNGSADIDVSYGNDGTYPAVYIGGVATSWTKPQIAVINVFPGNYEYDPTDWNSGWVISVTTTLGTISETSTAEGYQTPIDAISWGDWQTVTSPWTYPSGSTYSGILKYRKTNDDKQLQIYLNALVTAAGGNEIYDLPSGYIPDNVSEVAGRNHTSYETFYVSTAVSDGQIFATSPTTISTYVTFTGIVPLD